MSPTTTRSRPTRPLPITTGTLVLALAAAVLVAAPAAAAGGPGSAGSSGTAAVPGSPTGGIRQPANSLPGIDVSHWQGSVDWATVAADGQRFVFAKATEGQTFDDPLYAANKAGAAAAGLSFAAYHFARPDASANDAILEANHFVDVAQLGPGNLRPVLDIEVSGGLDALQLTNWALAWLGEVTARLGVKPMVYTSPNGWENKFGDTTAVADAGYELWVAHWEVSSPTVPANGWSGRGWTFWQHTDCATVPGISGCVDHDWYGATDLGLETIRGLTVSVTSQGGSVTSSPGSVSCTALCAMNVDPGTVVTLTETPNPGAVFLGWGGACSGTGSTCTVTMDADRSVTASFGFDVVPPSVTLTAPADLDGALTATFSEVVHQLTASNLVLRVQGTTSDELVELTCRSPGGGTTSCSTGKVMTAELQPAAPLVPGQAYTAILDPAEATSPVVDAGMNPVPTTTVDFITPTDVEQTSAAATYRWRTVSDHAAYGHSYAVEHLAGASASFTFSGKKVTWYTVTGPSQGRAKVSIDGHVKGHFNQYASSTHHKVARTFKDLARGPHTIIVTVVGTKGSKEGTDEQVAVDAFAVGGEITKDPPLLELWRSVRSSGASGGSFARSDLAGSTVSFSFRGSGVDWYTVLGPDQGNAQVLVDGAQVKVVNGYAKKTTFGAKRSIGGLADAVHTVEIVVLGESKPAASGRFVSFDRFVVR